MNVLVPQIDKSPSLIRLAQSLLGKFILLGAFVGISYLINSKLAPYMTVVLSALILLPRRGTLVLVLGNIYYLSFGPFIFSNLRPHTLTPMWDLFSALLLARGINIPLEWLGLLGLKTLLTLALLGFFWLYLTASENFRFVARHPLLTLYSFIVALLALVSSVQMLPWLGLILWALLNCLTRAYLYMAYTAADQKLITEKSRILKSATFVPFWNGGAGGINVVPRGYRGIENTSAQNPEELAICQLSGLKLLWWSLLLHLLAQFVARVLDSPPSANLVEFMKLNPLWHQRWLSMMGGTLIFLISFASATGVVIAMVRVAGFKVYRQVYRPYQARDFNDFLGRIYFYYIDVIIKFFFYPCWRYSRFLSGSKSLRIFVTAFSALTIAGLVQHFMASFTDMVELGLMETLRLTVARAPYFVMLGVIVGTTSLISRHRPSSAPTFLRRLFNSAFFFMLYTLCWAVQAGYRTDSWHDRATFVLSLFGIAL